MQSSRWQPGELALAISAGGGAGLRRSATFRASPLEDRDRLGQKAVIKPCGHPRGDMDIGASREQHLHNLDVAGPVEQGSPSVVVLLFGSTPLSISTCTAGAWPLRAAIISGVAPRTLPRQFGSAPLSSAGDHVDGPMSIAVTSGGSGGKPVARSPGRMLARSPTLLEFALSPPTARASGSGRDRESRRTGPDAVEGQRLATSTPSPSRLRPVGTSTSGLRRARRSAKPRQDAPAFSSASRLQDLLRTAEPAAMVIQAASVVSSSDAPHTTPPRTPLAPL